MKTEIVATGFGRQKSKGFDAKKILGRKGLLAKDQATRLALCAAKFAIAEAGIDVGIDPESFGVAVSSNYGNLDTVSKVVKQLHQTHVEDLSILDAPNASSNVIASTLAIRYHCQAVNLMLCSGAGSCLQAIMLAANCIKRQRAERMLVVNVEPSDCIFSGEHIIDGASAVILESKISAQLRRVCRTVSLDDLVIKRGVYTTGGSDVEI